MPRDLETVPVAADQWTLYSDAIAAVRTAVFVDEQGIPVELEWDGMDPHCTHVLVRDAQGRPLATGRLMPDGRIGRMAVLAAWRRQGVGKRVLAALLQQARSQGMREVWLHAQVSAADFYRAAGFHAKGTPFLEAGITHIEMRCLL